MVNDTLCWRRFSAPGQGSDSSSTFTHPTNTYPLFGVALSVTFEPYAFEPAPLTVPAVFELTAADTLNFLTVQRA